MYHPCHITESHREHYISSFESLDKLASYISSAGFSEASFGDVEAVIQKKGRKSYDCWHRDIFLNALLKR